MNASAWQEANNRYLAASLRWLRLRLDALVPRTAITAGEVVVVAAPEKGQGLFDRLRGPAKSNETAPARLTAPAEGPNVLEQAAAERDEAGRSEPPPALVVLANSFGLSSFERDTLLLCAAADLDPGLAALCSAIPGNGGRGSPTFALALQALPDPAWDALSPHRPLRYSRLLELNQPGATALTAAGLRADERIVNYIKGLNVIDERLGTLLGPETVEPGPLAPSQDAVAEALADHLRRRSGEGRLPTVMLLGSDIGCKLDLAATVCADVNRRLYRLGLGELPAARGDLEIFARLWQRESLLLPVALYIEAADLDGASPEQAAALQWLCSRELGLAFVDVRERPAWSTEHAHFVEVGRPTTTEQRDAWQQIIDADAPGTYIDAGALLAGQFDLSLRDIRAVASAAPEMGSEALWQACCRLTRPRLDLLAQRIDARATWDDLVLPAAATGLLRQIVAQVRGRYRVYQEWGYAARMTRGLGISALFAGESGTGKTMAAEVLANDLGLALYRIDLSSIVSKYIGETEKNLRKLFDAAEQGGAILFFDEADALFGKRSEVKDSHDRYANIEINYLLQRMEAFSGIAILATNMKSAVDNAFLRRLRFVVNFPYPGVPERKLMWQKALAAGVPREALDFEKLARFNLSGGNIQSIALNAAFAAAGQEDGGQAVTMPLLLTATRIELRKLERQVNEAEFRLVSTGDRGP